MQIALKRDAAFYSQVWTTRVYDSLLYTHCFIHRQIDFKACDWIIGILLCYVFSLLMFLTMKHHKSLTSKNFIMQNLASNDISWCKLRLCLDLLLGFHTLNCFLFLQQIQLLDNAHRPHANQIPIVIIMLYESCVLVFLISFIWWT